MAEFKAKQRETWALGNFGDVAVFTTPVAAHLVRFAGVAAGHSILDVGTGTGVVAITAARLGARVSGLDLTPELLEQARHSSRLAGVGEIDWKEGDAEALPYPDGSFDIVLSQFGHMFAPRPEVAVAEMLRVLKSDGRIAFATWPPEHFIGRGFALGAKYVPPPPGVAPPGLWGDPGVVRERLGATIRNLHFEHGVMLIPALSAMHYFEFQSSRAGPFIRVIRALETNPARLAAYRKEVVELVSAYLADNVVRHEYLLTRASKA
jgi:SAM-dependent methyltransferase